MGGFTGDLTGTASNATQLGGQAASHYLNASNLSSGTIPDARFPSTLPAIDGSALTGIAGTANIITNTLEVVGVSTLGDAIDVDGSITCDDIITAGAVLHEGDTDTLMHFSSANNIEFKTNGVSRFLINNFGASVQALSLIHI